MSLIGAIVAVIMALVIGVVFYYFFKVTGPWGSFWAFLIILILVGLSAALWIPPIGPYYWGIAWIPTIFVIVLFAILIAAATPSTSTETYERGRISEERAKRSPVTRDPDASGAAALGAFFWILLVLLLLAVLFGAFM